MGKGEPFQGATPGDRALGPSKKAWLVKTGWNYCKNRQRDKRHRIDQRNKIKSSETDAGVGGNLTYDKGHTLSQQGKTDCFKNGVGGSGQLYREQKKQTTALRRMRRWNPVGPKRER